MATWNARRQLLYLTSLLLMAVIVGLVLFLIYRPRPSCFDGQQNQNEAGIDCGGSCQAICNNATTPLAILWSRAFPLGGNNYDLAALVDNLNPDLGIARLTYTFRILDSSNVLVGFRQGETYINPQGKTLLFFGRLNTGARPVGKVFIELDQSPTWQKVTTPPPVLAITEQSFVNGPQPLLHAVIANSSLDDVANIELTTVLSDSSGNAITVSSTAIDFLAAGARRHVFFTWPAALPVTPTTIDIYPRINLTSRH